MAAMNQEDCYYYYYSSCSKGATCPFRHEPAALGSEEVCTLWREGRCMRSVCGFRHMEIVKDRSTIPCYWENQPSGCQKPHCVFYHTKPRGVDGVPTFPVQQQREWGSTSLPPQHKPNHPHQAQGITPTATSGALSYAQPQVQQMVINPFDEESDQESIGGGTPVKKPPQENCAGMPRTVMSSSSGSQKEDSMNFAIKSLEEIRRDKKRKQEKDDAVCSQTSEDSLQVQNEPTKKIKLNVVKSPVKESTAVVVKSLEEITREKALQSLAKRKALKAAEAKREQLMLSAVPRTADVVDSSRRIIVKQDGQEAKKSAPKRILRIKDRLGKLKDSDSEDTNMTSVKCASNRLKDRLGRTQTNDASQKTTGGGSHIKSRLGISRKLEESTESGSQGEEADEQEKAKTSDVDLGKIQIKSLAEIRAEKDISSKTKKDVSDVHIKTLDEIHKEKRGVLSLKTVVPNVDSAKDDTNETDPEAEKAKTPTALRKENSARSKLKILVKDDKDTDSERHSKRKMKLKRSKESESPQIIRRVTVNPASFDDFELKSSKLKRKITEDPSSSIKIRRLPISEPAAVKKKTAKQPKIKLYEPPALKKQGKPCPVKEVQPKVSEEKSRRTISRKSHDWGVKTFSEIMAEKRMQKQQTDEKKNVSSESSTEDGPKTIKTPPKRTITPITFNDSDTAPRKPKSRITPITFGDESTRPKIVQAKKKPSSSIDDDLDDFLGESAESLVDPLGTMRGSPLAIDKTDVIQADLRGKSGTTKVKKALPDVQPAQQQQPLDTAISGPNVHDAQSQGPEIVPNSGPCEVTSSDLNPSGSSNAQTKTTFAFRRPSQQASERKKRTSMESGRLSVEQATADSTTVKTPVSASRQKSLTDDLDFLDEELDDLLGDSVDYRDHAPLTLQTDDALLQEMEELLA